MRRLPVWLVAVPLALAGTEFAHAVAYRIVAPGASERAGLLADTGHSYLHWLPLAAVAGALLVLVGIGFVASAATRAGAPPGRLARWPFALLPFLTFTGQELLERLIHDGHLSPSALVERTFLLGVLLQAPFALAAWLVALLVLRGAVRLAHRLSTRPPRIAAPPPQVAWRSAERAAPLAIVGYHVLGRGPPVLPAG